MTFVLDTLELRDLPWSGSQRFVLENGDHYRLITINLNGFQVNITKYENQAYYGVSYENHKILRTILRLPQNDWQLETLLREIESL